MYGAMVMFLQVDAMSETINDLVNLCGKNLWDGGYSSYGMEDICRLRHPLKDF